MLTIGEAFGHYEIVEKLGEGGMGAVYKARDTRLNRLVALKVLLPQKLTDELQLKRFQQEAHAASKLNHSNIVVIYDISTEQDTAYIAMEFVRGKTLNQIIPRKGMRLSEALNVAIQITDGMSAAAAAGIIHRDLKPANIMVTDSGQVKILDFGIAKMLGTGGEEGLTLALDDAPRTREGTMVGTVAYMSPEQAEGRPLDTRSDIFSFGSVLFEMVTGQRAFQGATTISMITAILRDDPRPLSEIAPDVPNELETIIKRCMRKDPGRRFQSIADVRISLLDLKEETESARLQVLRDTTKTQAPVPVQVPKRRVKWWIPAAVALVVAAMGGLGWFLLHRTPAAKQLDVHVMPFASYEGFKGYPAFSPDGNQIAFTWTGGGTAGLTHIYVKFIGTESPLEITSGPSLDSHAAFAPDGRSIAFLRSVPGGHTDVFQTSPLGGVPRLIAEIPSTFYQTLNWSRDGKWLVTAGQSASENKSRIFVISAANGQYRTLSFGNTQDEFYPALAPDSRFIAFSRQRSYADWDLVVAPLDENLQAAGGERLLAVPPGLNRQAAWTEDGKELVFANGGTSTTALWRISASGEGAPRRLTFTGDSVYHPAIATVGERLAYTHDYNNTNIWKIPITGDGKTGEAVPLINTTRSSYARPNGFSNDGTKIAFESNLSGAYGIWTANRDGTGGTLLYNNGDISSGSPAWSRDSQWVAFDTRSGKIGQIFLISRNGGTPRQITNGPADNILPSWSQDGKWIYFDSNRTGRFEIFKRSPDGGEAIQVTHNGGWGGQESPDGKTLYYTRTRAVSGPLLMMPVAGGPETEVLQGVHERWWGVAAKGIWFMVREGTEADPGLWSMESAVSGRADIRFFSFATKKVSTVTVVPKMPAGGLALAPDGKALMVSEVERQAYEIELAENFR